MMMKVPEQLCQGTSRLKATTAMILLLYLTRSGRWMLTGYENDPKSTSNATNRREKALNTTGFQTRPNAMNQISSTNYSGEDILNSTINQTTSELTNETTRFVVAKTCRVTQHDYIFQKKTWDSAPIVLERFKLVFFTTPKVACTVFKKLFRRMMGLKDWRTQNSTTMIPYNPKVNGLRYLYYYNLANATYIMTSPEYTRAMFVRDPKERFVSAYLDKAVRNQGSYLIQSCCPNGSCTEGAQSVAGFLKLAQTCLDEHWVPQARRVDEKYWPYINFIGHMDHLGRDAERLLKRVKAWKKYGKSGWGRYGNESIFMSSDGVEHATDAGQRVDLYITSPELEEQIDEYYAEDYSSPWLNLTKRNFVNVPGSHATNERRTLAQSKGNFSSLEV
jgi:hypothetical protein